MSDKMREATARVVLQALGYDLATEQAWAAKSHAASINVLRDAFNVADAIIAHSRPTLATSIVTEDDGSGDLISPDSEAAERIYDPAFIAGWKAARSRPVTAGAEPMAYYIEHAKHGVELSLDPIDEASQQRGWTATPLYAAPPAAAGREETEDDAGIDFALEQLCAFLGVDLKSVTWDAATETRDGDVQAVIGNILRAKFGEDFDPAVSPQHCSPGEKS